MRVKLTNKQTVEMINIFAGMMGKQLPRKLAFAIGKNMENLQTQIYKPYEAELKRIKAEHELLDENKNQMKNEKGQLLYKNPEAYAEELVELLEIENDFDMHTIKEEVLEQCENEAKWSKLTVAEEIACMRMVEG